MGKTKRLNECEMAKKLKDKYGLIYVEGKSKMFFRFENGLYEYVHPFDLNRLIWENYGWDGDYRITHLTRCLKGYSRINVKDLHKYVFSETAQLFLVYIKGRRWHKKFLERKKKER